jgi:spermidine synthase
VLGDARLSLESEAALGQLQKFDVVVLDAFNSDSIPVHLLTKEAMALYIRHLSGPDSVIAFHLSSRALDLRPVADGLSREYRMTCVEIEEPFSDWVLASANTDMMNTPELKKRSTPVTVRHAVPLWTDEYSNLWDVVRPMR